MLISLYQAEKLKSRRRPEGKLVVIMPVVLTLLSAFLARSYIIVDNYNWWYIGVYPAVMALVCAEICGAEKRTGNQNVLTLPADIKRIWDAKVLWGIRMSAVSMSLICLLTIFLSIGFQYRFHIELITEVGIGQQLLAGVILFLTFLWQVPFCLILEQLAGAPTMLLIHMFIYVMASCSLSLTPFFLLLPGAVPARMMCIVLHILPNGLPAKEGMTTFVPELLDKDMLLPGIVCSFVWFLILWRVSRSLYERQVTGR